jgi:hypothetical protein
MSMKWWVGVKNRPPQTVFAAEEQDVTPERYPQFAYVSGPFENQSEALKFAASHVNLDGSFTDPFCNNGQGR